MDDRLLEKILELNKDIAIRPATLKDAGAFTQLVNTYAPRKKTNSYFNWLYVLFDGEKRLFVAYHQNQLAGFFGCQIRQLNNGSKVSLCTELLIDENYRNTGLFFLLEKELSQYSIDHEATAIFALATQSGKKSYLGLGTWDSIGIVKPLILPKGNLVGKKLERFQAYPGKLIFFEKDKKYIDWRFGNHYLYKYDFFDFPNKNAAVTKFFKDEITKKKYVDIVHFECDLLNEIELNSLFDNLISNYSKSDIDAITTWALPHSLAYQLLKGKGFFENDQERYFCAKILNKNFEYLLDFKRWHLVQADSEIY